MSVDYGFVVGDRDCHRREISLTGTAVAIDDKYDLGGITTCNVHWDDFA